MLATISDNKRQHSSDGSTIDYYLPDVLSAQNYYPFGMKMPVRIGMGIPGGLVEETVPPPVVLEEDNYDTGVGGWKKYNTATIINDNGRVKVSTDIEWGIAQKELNLVPGRRYRVRFTLDMGNCKLLSVIMWDPISQTFERMSGTGSALSSSGNYVGTFEAQVFRTLFFFEVVPGNGNPVPDSTAYFWIDNFSIEEYTLPYEIVPRNYWTEVKEDDGRLKVVSKQPWGEASKFLHLTAGKKYRLRYTVDLGNLDPMHVIIYNPADGSYTFPSETGLGFHDSGEKMGTFTAAADELELRFQLPLIPAGADSVYCWLDNIYLEEVVAYVPGGGAEGDGGYRYGFNGQEKSIEINGSENFYTAEFWQYDSRIGRRWNVDPKASKMSSWSPYSAFFNNPLRFTDPTGMAPDDWYYWMSSEGKLMKREVKNSTNNVYLMNYDEKNPSNDKYVLINEFNPKSKGNNLLMIAFIGGLVKDADGGSLTKEYGFSPNYPDKDALAYSRSALGQIFLNTNRKMSADYYDLLNSVSHEVGHLKIKDNTLREHAGVYLYGFKDPSFSQSTLDHKIGTVRSFANYLYNIYDRENYSASIETISPLLDKFKKLNTGISISYDFRGPTNRGGLNLYVNGSLVDYKLIDEKTHKQ